MMRIGIVSLILSIGLVVAGFILILATDTMLEPLSTILCPTNQTLSRETSSFRGETDVTFYCVNDDGVHQNEVTGWVVLMMFGLFIPMVISILLVVVAGVGKTRRAVEVVAGSYGAREDVLDPLANQARHVNVGVGEPTLQNKLQQLKDAYEAGLINKWEYDDRKEQILDEFTE